MRIPWNLFALALLAAIGLVSAILGWILLGWAITAITLIAAQWMAIPQRRRDKEIGPGEYEIQFLDSVGSLPAPPRQVQPVLLRNYALYTVPRQER